MAKRKLIYITTRKIGAFGNKNKAQSLFLPLPKVVKTMFKKGNMVEVKVFNDGVEIHKLSKK